MASEEQRDLKKGLLKKDKLELVKLLKSKKQPTNGTKGDLVDRILSYDEKHGGKMARKASAASPRSEQEEEEYDGEEYDQDEEEYEEEYEEEEEVEEAPKPKPKKKKKSKPKKQSNTGGSGSGGNGAPMVACDCSPNIECGGGFIGMAQIATGIAAIGQLILGIIQFILLVEALQVCDPDIYNGCLGESLYWELGNDETNSFNWPWRTVFTFRPSYFFTNWTPMLFGLIAMMQMFCSTSWYFISGSWIRCLLFHLVMVLFAALPYCGKAGIVIGFVQVFAAFMCFIMCFADRGGGATYFLLSF